MMSSIVLICTSSAVFSFSVDVLFTPDAVVKKSKYGSVQVGRFDYGSYVFSHDGTAVFTIGKTEWDIDCHITPCHAQSGDFRILWNDNDQLILDAGEKSRGRISLKRSNRTRDFAGGVDAPLTDFEVDQLRRGGLMIIEIDEFIVASLDLTGIGTVLEFMAWAKNGQERLAQQYPSPLGYMQTVVESANAPRDILVPFTKPQVQFAIREQNGNPFVP